MAKNKGRLQHIAIISVCVNGLLTYLLNMTLTSKTEQKKID
ncbi:hypothetical protein [Priestia aryabhattai]